MMNSKMLQRGLGIAIICILTMSLVWAAPDRGQRGQQGQFGGQPGQFGGQPGQMGGQRGQQGQFGGQRGQQGQFGGQRGGFNTDPAAMQQRIMDALKTQLGITEDAEWAIIEPRLSKVMTLTQSSTNTSGITGMLGGMMRGMGRNRRPNVAGRDETRAVEEDPVQSATAILQETLDKADTSSDEIKNKLQAYRDAREKAQQELAKARQELRNVLTIRQEAQLVLMGMLD